MIELTGVERYLFWMNILLGPEWTRKAYNAFDGRAEEVFRAAAKNELGDTLNASAIQTLETHCNEQYIDKCAKRLDEMGVNVVTFLSDGYPELLREIYDPPTVLYYKGTLRRDMGIPIAMIGSRQPSDYGVRVAKEFAETMAAEGCCIISGMARGVDGICSREALKCSANDYPTVVVLGSGIDTAYPEENSDIYAETALRGAVISEYMPGIRPYPDHFPKRNRIISGLSRGVVVVEAAERSGTSITVNCALEQGRDVFAVPGRITDYKSVGTNRLIRNGCAKAVLSPYDVLEEYGISETVEKENPNDTRMPISDEGKRICELLKSGEKNFDELCELTGISVIKLNSTLTALEFSGIINQSPGRLYSL